MKVPTILGFHLLFNLVPGMNFTRSSGVPSVRNLVASVEQWKVRNYIHHSYENMKKKNIIHSLLVFLKKSNQHSRMYNMQQTRYHAQSLLTPC